MKNIAPLVLLTCLACGTLPGCGTPPHGDSTSNSRSEKVVTDAPAQAAPAPVAVLPIVPVATRPVDPEPLPVKNHERLKLAVVSFDSEEPMAQGEDGRAVNAVDGDPATFWHTQWEVSSPSCPHEIVIDLGRVARIDRFTYLPRQDGGINGTIKEYAFYVSADGENFGDPVSEGLFETNTDRKLVSFDAVSCRFIKLKALSEVNDGPWTSAAEIGVLQEGEEAE